MLLEKMGVLQMEGVKDERCQRLVLDVEDNQPGQRGEAK